MNAIEKLWMDAWAASHCTARLTVSGSKHCPDTVIAVLSEVFDALPFCLVNEPTIDEIEAYLHREDAAGRPRTIFGMLRVKTALSP